MNKNFGIFSSWNQAASREIAKRRPEIVLLPDTYNEIIEKSDFHLYDLLNEQPYVALLFVGPSLREREYRRDLEFSSKDISKLNLNYGFFFLFKM